MFVHIFGLALCVLALAAVQMKAQPASETLSHNLQERNPVCRRRGQGAYCSAGHVGGYIGPIDTAQELKAALKATAFNKEIIIFAENRVAHAAHAVSRLRGAAGYGHVLPVMDSRLCHRLGRIFVAFTSEQGPLSCVSYATADQSGIPYPAGFRYFRTGFGLTAWWQKWFTVARSVLLGYNVMAVDSDVLVLDDWYWRVKQPPISSYNMMSQAECDICINGGFSYIQNASSRGPVAWLLYEAVHRAVRWAEDSSAVTALSQRLTREPQWVTCADDQTLLTDTMWNAVNGKIGFGSMRCMLSDDEEALAKLGYEGSRRNHSCRPLSSQHHSGPTGRPGDFQGANGPGAGGAPGFFPADYELTGELAEVACDSFNDPWHCRRFGGNISIQSAVLRMPHSGGVWPKERGGYPFNPEIGPYTRAYRQAMLDLGVPLPPDPEDPATAQQAKDTQPELFGLLNVLGYRGGDGRCSGCWLESQWYVTGRLGLWHTHLSGVPQVQSIGHLHAGLYPGDFQKLLLMQVTGHYDWRVAGRLGGGPYRVFYTNYPDYRALEWALLEKVEDFQRVVAYAPGVITPQMSKEDFVRASAGLAQVAVSLGAVAAWPAVPCTSDWVLSPQARASSTSPRGAATSAPWFHINTAYTVLPFGESWDQLQCEWTAFTSEDCLMNRRHSFPDGRDSGRGMLAVEFAHLLQRRAHHNATLLRGPTPETTLRLTEWYEVQQVHLLLLNSEVLLQQLHQHEPVTVMWLDRLVGAVQGMADTTEQTYNTWKQRCRALKYFDLPEYERNACLAPPGAH
ncbi:hypothetical protein VOLCADRAFT_97349 [Volvox carteri f. nagariensis]|uniref:Nucleotide-diphospho-sugar transferase domain-containing protein n=1 Tax=Volvox carteri f. nagariensis TaxID=3068 RepID=D8UCI7_VOLCA|nr:uncharacterized protein VOLCADRAFT_97349 [Volvox carteri f. nagariensis]EFJ42558.1 hypothetical protein VOLCADRAFT_97349 [Volvox carteri f. nagariensis]|eukprot:XP_002956414.1 hypothetical protein VOLCADRAFT_97349 [Volvox carteri f. nagariensis]